MGRLRTVTVDVDVDVDLDEFGDEDLIEELEARGYIVSKAPQAENGPMLDAYEVQIALEEALRNRRDEARLHLMRSLPREIRNILD